MKMLIIELLFGLCCWALVECAIQLYLSLTKIKRLKRHMAQTDEAFRRALQAARDGNEKLFTHWERVHHDLIYNHKPK